jgi:hypothetical protein
MIEDHLFEHFPFPKVTREEEKTMQMKRDLWIMHDLVECGKL